MIYTTERIQRAIKNNREIRDAVRNIPNDMELGGYVRDIYRYDDERENLNKQQLSLDFDDKKDPENETFLTKYEYKRNMNWLGR